MRSSFLDLGRQRIITKIQCLRSKGEWGSLYAGRAEHKSNRCLHKGDFGGWLLGVPMSLSHQRVIAHGIQCCVGKHIMHTHSDETPCENGVPRVNISFSLAKVQNQSQVSGERVYICTFM